ncbi:MAG: alpha-L-fucosidase [Bacteroidetes bacterium]|nr:alpha-L-fucosidase [Bacteroidota bacterium]
MKHIHHLQLLIVLFCLSLAFQGFSQNQEKDSLSQEWERMRNSKEKALSDFNETKFGMFITWGTYSLPAGIWKGEKIEGLGEWIMHRAKIPGEDYLEMCGKFNPINFDADKWVRMAKMAGMKYIVAMPKHHDGFAMYDSKVSDYDIIDATPFDRDPMEELYRACQKHGLNFSIYYSHATDWLDGGDAGVADFLDTGKEVEMESKSPFWQTWPSNTWDPAPVSFTEYLEKKAKPQMRELLEKFPGMQEIWYDVPRRMTREQSFEFYKLAYEIQPSCLINSRVGNDFGDFWIPGDNKIPEGEEGAGVYWETPGTLNNTWGYKSYDQDWKSTEELLFWITEIASKGGNYLLNVGPTSEGVIPEKSQEQLKAIGKWMDINGESVYGTGKWQVSHEGPTSLSMKGSGEREKKGFTSAFTPKDFWFSAKDNCIYATSLKWPEDKQVLIKSISQLKEEKEEVIKNVQMLGCKGKLSWEMGDKGLEVLLPACRPNPNGYVLKIKLK